MKRVGNITRKSISSIKNEGIVDFSKKAINYIRFRKHRRTKKKILADILIINGCTLPHPERYRVDHQIEQLNASGVSAEKVYYEKLSLDMLKYYRGFIFFRCPVTEIVEQFIEEAKKENKTVFFDIDDLVIDQKYTDTIPFIQNMNEEQKAVYDDGVNRMRKTLEMCEYCITTTEGMEKELLNYSKEVFINRNVASEYMTMLSLEAIKEKKATDDIIIGYLSGSITHNPDVELVKPIILKMLEKYKNVKLKLVGEITLPEEFKKYSNQIIIEPFMDWKKLPKVIASLDINLAPLENSVFNEAKSENKWVEAALCKVVTIASNIGAFKEMIDHKVNGVLCNNLNEWEKYLEELICDKKLRNKIAENAHKRVMKNNITTYTGHELAKFIKSKLKRNIAFVLPTTNISGGVNVILKHICVLKQNGNDVCIINMDDSEIDVNSKWGNIRVVSANKTEVKAYFNTMVASLWTTLYYIKELPNVKNIMYLVQNFETDFGSFGQIMKIDANATYEDETGRVKYLTISKWCEEWLKSKFEKEVRFAPNGIDLEQFEVKDKRFSGEKTKVLIEGNSDDYYKNVDESFKIVEKLDKSKFEIQFLSYQGKPKKWYYVDKFMHKVPYKDVYKVYQNADILIKSSILESFSYPPLEMMATGGIVVVAPNEGNIEYVKDNENCLCYNQGDIEDAVDKITQVVEDKDLRKKIISNGINTARSREWKNIENEIIKLYEEN